MDELPSNQNENDPGTSEKENSVPSPSLGQPIKNQEISDPAENKSDGEKGVNWPAWIQAFSAVAIVFITGFYTYYASVQATQMRNATTAAQQSADAATKAAGQAQQANTDAWTRFGQGERPYVWLTSNGLGSPEFIPEAGNTSSTTGQVIWTWHFTNYGRTPAYNVRWHHYVSINGGPFIESYRAPSAGDGGGPLPPTEDDFSTVVSRPSVTRQEFEQAISPRGKGVSILIRMDYTDSSGRKYSTAICLQRLNAGAIAFCAGSYIQ